MATLDERLEDEEYRHWLEAALCLQYTKDGLVPLADQKSQKLHSDLLKQLRSNGNLSVNRICPNPRINFKTRLIQAYLFVASRHFTGPGALFLKNSDITNLPKQHWQSAKLFMNAGQDASNIDPSQTDISGILNFIDHCDLAKAAIQNTNCITQVRDTRNRILHNPDMKITKHDFSTNITPALIDLLQDPLYLLNNPAAQDAVIKIKQVESSSFHISKKDEIQALKDMLVEHNKGIQGLDTVVRGINARVLDLTTKMNDSGETTGKEISNVHINLSRELEEQKTEIQTEIQKVQISIECLKNKIKDDNGLHNLISDKVTEMLEVPLKDIRVQVQSLHQELKRLKNRLDSVEKKTTKLQQDQSDLKIRLDIEEKKTTVELGALNTRVDNLGSKVDDMQGLVQNLQEPLTTVSPEDELELQQHLRDGYKQSRLQVPTFPRCYNLPVSKMFAPVVILKKNKSGLKASEALEQNKQDPNMHGKGEEQDQKIRSYKTMFYENGILQNHNFLLGKAGVGKTTFSKHLVDIWCNASQSPYYDDAGWLEQFKFVFHVECRHASESESVFDMICDQLIERESLKNVAKRVLSTKPDECLVIADGLDEWKGSPNQSAKTSYDIPGLPSTINLHKCVMLTTSRPWRVHALSQRFEQTGRVLELQGIDNVKTLTTTILTELQEANPGQACQAFLESVKANNMEELIQIPLMLINVLTIWHTHKSLNPSICVNYSYMVEDFIKRAKGESGRDGDEKRLTETTVRGLSKQEPIWAESARLLPDCFRSTDFCKGYAGLIINLGHLAFDLLVREKHEQSLVFSTQETMSYLNEKELEVCLTIGILSQSQAPGRGIQKMDKLCFCHKTFQEFFGSLWLSKKYSKFCDKFYECCKTLDDVFDYSVFVQFLCGFCPSVGKIFWQYIVNEVIEKDVNIQKKRQKNIVARGSYLFPHTDIFKLGLLALACTEEARHNYQEDQKLYYFIPDLCIVTPSTVSYTTDLSIDTPSIASYITDLCIDTPSTASYITEQQQTFLFKLLHENMANIKSVEVYGEYSCSQIVASVNKMTGIVCISLHSDSWSRNHPVLSSGSEESPMLELPQQIRSLCLVGWTIKGLRNDLPIHLTALKFAILTMSHSLIESLSLCLRTSSSLQYLNLSNLDCIDHRRKCCSIVLDLQRHHRLEELELLGLSVQNLLLPHHQEIDLSTVKDLLLPTDLPEDADLRVLVLTSVTLTHRNLKQLNSYLAACSTLHELTLDGLSCIDNGESCCLQEIDLDIQKHHSLRNLTLGRLSVGSLMLPGQPDTCLKEMKLDELTLTHYCIEHLCRYLRYLAEYSGLKMLDLNILSCSDHGKRGCLIELDLQKHRSLDELTLAELSVGSVMLPVQPETCVRMMQLQELILTHHSIEQLGRCVAEYSGLVMLELNTISCSDHGERGCFIELDLQKHRRLAYLTLAKLSVGSVMLPVQPETCLRHIKLHELTLTHHGIEQLGRCVAEYSGSVLELNTISCSDHGERGCFIELDLQKHRSLRVLSLAKLSVGSVILPVQPEPRLRRMKLHELILTHHGIEQLGRCVAEYSSLELNLDTVSCCDHGDRGCFIELDLQKHCRLHELTLAKLSVRSMMLPVQPETCLRKMKLHELILTHHSIEQLGRCVAEYSGLVVLKLNTISCSDHGERGCFIELDLQKHRSLEELTLEKFPVGSVMLPVQPDTCLWEMKLHKLTLTHHCIEQLCLAECSCFAYLDRDSISCSDHGEWCLSTLNLQNYDSS